MYPIVAEMYFFWQKQLRAKNLHQKFKFGLIYDENKKLKCNEKKKRKRKENVRLVQRWVRGSVLLNASIHLIMFVVGYCWESQTGTMALVLQANICTQCG